MASAYRIVTGTVADVYSNEDAKRKLAGVTVIVDSTLEGPTSVTAAAEVLGRFVAAVMLEVASQAAPVAA